MSTHSDMYNNLKDWVNSFSDEVTVGVTGDSGCCLVRNYLGCMFLRCTRVGQLTYVADFKRYDIPRDVQYFVYEFDNLSYWGMEGHNHIWKKVEITAFQARSLFH